MEGWVKLYRKLLKWEWYKDTNTKSLFIHLILMANHENKFYRGTLIKRGQLVTSLNILSKELNISIQSIRTGLDHLKATREVTSKLTNQYRIITVCNYDTYQCHETGANKPANNKQEDKEFKEKRGKKKRTPLSLKDSNITIQDIASTFQKAPDLKFADPVYYFRVFCRSQGSDFFTG